MDNLNMYNIKDDRIFTRNYDWKTFEKISNEFTALEIFANVPYLSIEKLLSEVKK